MSERPEEKRTCAKNGRRVSQRKTWRWRTAYCHPAVCRLFLGSIGFPLIESLKKSRLRPRAEGQRGRGAEGQRGRGAEGQRGRGPNQRFEATWLLHIYAKTLVRLLITYSSCITQ